MEAGVSRKRRRGAPLTALEHRAFVLLLDDAAAAAAHEVRVRAILAIPLHEVADGPPVVVGVLAPEHQVIHVAALRARHGVAPLVALGEELLDAAGAGELRCAASDDLPVPVILGASNGERN